MATRDELTGRTFTTTVTSATMPGSTGASGLTAEPHVSLLLYHRDGCQMAALVEGQSLVVGRARPADLPVRDRSLSRQHARFELIRGVVWVEDLESTNGTLLRGKKIRRSRLKEGDEVRLGAVTAVVHVLSPAQEALAGLDSHDRLQGRLEEELVRAQTFSRSLAVLMVRAEDPEEGHLSRWSRRVRGLLRPVDAMALHDPSSVLILLAESGREQALALAEAIHAKRARGEPQLVCGVAGYPEHASSVEGLLEAVRLAARRASKRTRVVVAEGGAAPAWEADGEGAVVRSPAMLELHATVRRVAESAAPVLILGETGSGKEVLARALHEASRRRGRLCCLNCGAIPEQLRESALFGHERGAFTGAARQANGIFEEAEGGTVLLDEIGELSPSAQATLLRVIETKRISRVGSTKELAVDVRVVAATHRDLEVMCADGRFRWDLFYRLNALSLKIPPLRERREEILPLAQRFLALANRTNGTQVRRIDEGAERLLADYSWPGNVRELRNVIERAALLAQEQTITVDDLSERVRRAAAPVAPAAAGPALPEGEAGSIKDKLRRYEAGLLLEALKAHDWNQTRTAEALGMPLRTLVHKMRTLGLKKTFSPEG